MTDLHFAEADMVPGSIEQLDARYKLAVFDWKKPLDFTKDSKNPYDLRIIEIKPPGWEEVAPFPTEEYKNGIRILDYSPQKWKLKDHDPFTYHSELLAL